MRAVPRTVASDAEFNQFLTELWRPLDVPIPGDWETFGTTGRELEIPCEPGSQDERSMVQRQVDAGQTNENLLANDVFFARHPDRHRRLLSPDKDKNFSKLSREWICIRDTLVRPILRRPADTPVQPIPRAANLVLVSGGPGLYDDRDPEHDKSWANYVTPPLLLSERADFVGSATEVWWLIYRPAYPPRWNDDVAEGRPSVDDVRGKGFGSYSELLEARARERGWQLRWFDSADDLWARFASFRDPIVRVWYWGHASTDLWLTLTHTRWLWQPPVKPPPPHAIVTVKSISAHAGLRSRFSPGLAHRFVGCNTAAFAKEWSRVFGVAAEGVEGKVHFKGITDSGGEPTLIGTARWRRFSARVPQPVP